jgi:hypothetical protein
MRRIMWSLVVAMSLVLPMVVLADSVTPDTFSATLDVGQSVTIHKTVTVNNAPPTTAKVDVFFLFDTTGSMGGTLDAAKAGAATIMANASGLGDVAFGVGQYKDFPTYPWGESSDIPYAKTQDMTKNNANIQAAINSLLAGGGYDYPESDLYALKQVADTTTWRDDSKRIVVWFGDAPGHEPSNTPGYPGPDTADTIAALNGENIVVEALNVGFLDEYGQATAITTATGGNLFNSVSSDQVVAKIQQALEAAFQTYNSVNLEVVGGVPAGLDISIAPTDYTGSFDRSIERTFAFDVTVTGKAPGDYMFDIAAKVDGAGTAFERDHVTVRGTSVPDMSSSMLLLGFSSLFLGWMRKMIR